MTRYCENCYSKMKRQVKRLGRCNTWFVCPKCGVREHTNEYSEEVEVRLKASTGIVPLSDEEVEP